MKETIPMYTQLLSRPSSRRVPHVSTRWMNAWMVAVGAGMFVSTLMVRCAQAETVVIEAHAIYPEGPVWRDGKLFYVEYGGAGVKMWDGQTSHAYWTDEHCGPSGLIQFKGNHLLVACYDANTLVELDETARAIRTIDKDKAGHAFIGPNDFALDQAGGLYFSASGIYDIKAPISGAILYLAPNGTVTEVADTIHYSNGLTVSEDGKTLLVSEDLAGRILAFPIKSDGSLGIRSVWARLRDLMPPTPHDDAYNGPDGLKLGPDGNYYIAQNGSGRVLVVDKDKKLVRSISVATPYVTNMTFGAAGTGTVYITGVFDPWKAPFPGVVYRWSR
jgi:gluconolactonase